MSVREPWATPEYEERRKAHRAAFRPRKDADVASHVLAALDVGAAWWGALLLRKQWRKLEPTTRALLRAKLAPHVVGTQWPFTKRQAVGVFALRDDGLPRPSLKATALPALQRIQNEHPDYSERTLLNAARKLGHDVSRAYLRRFIAEGALLPTPKSKRPSGHTQS